MSESTEQRLEFVVGDDEDGRRLDHLLVARLPDLSRSRIQDAVARDAAAVDGRTRPARYRPRAGSRIVFRIPEPPPTGAEPEDIPLRIVYEDASLLVVDKPAGMVVHPAPGHRGGTLVNALLHRFASLPGRRERAGLVHRLDRDTSGLLVVALTDAAHRHLASQLRERTLGRTYSALSWGQWDGDEGVIDAPLGRHPSRRRMMAVVEGGRAARTRWRVEEDFGFVQHCAVRLETGRTHQIRVHFAHRHHPVVGDPVYGDDSRVKRVHPLDRDAALAMVGGAGRQMLHARELRLRHPDDDRPCTFAAPLPDDFAAVLAGLRAARPAADRP